VILKGESSAEMVEISDAFQKKLAKNSKFEQTHIVVKKNINI
jgi:hypothetical protein